MLTLEKQINETVLLSKEDWENLSPFSEKRSVKKNESVIFDSHLSQRIYYIVNGALTISKESVKEAVPASEALNAGNFFGIEAFILGKRETQVGRAIEATQLLEIPFDKLQQLDAEIPSLSLAVHKAFLFSLSQQLDQKKSQASKILASSRLVALGEMISNLVHEINNPLTTLRLLTNQLVDFVEGLPQVTSKTSQLTTAIDRTFEHLIKIINGVRISSRTGETDVVECVLAKDLLQSAVKLCQGRIHDTSCTVSLNITPPDLRAWCRPSQIIQVLINLISNAHDAACSQAQGWIEIRAEERAGCVEFSVSDNGCGIPKGLEEKVFEAFYSTKPQGKGTGVGLSLSKKLIEQNGGKLYYDSHSPHTRFYFSLPKEDQN